LPAPEFTGLPAFAGNDAVGRMTRRKAKAPPGNGFVMPAKAGIQYAVPARSGNALIAPAVSTGLPAFAGNDGE